MLSIKITKVPNDAYGNKRKQRESLSLPFPCLNFNLKKQHHGETNHAVPGSSAEQQRATMLFTSAC